VKGETNVVVDALSRYYKLDLPDENHADYRYTCADIRIDPDGEDLPSARIEEVARMAAMRLPERPEDCHLEAAELSPMANARPMDRPRGNDPVASRSKNREEAQRLDLGHRSEFLEAIQVVYKKDALFSKIIEKPEHHKAFMVKDGLLIGKNQAGDKVLCIPKGKMGACEL
jgi:hypothetical protein